MVLNSNICILNGVNYQNILLMIKNILLSSLLVTYAVIAHAQILYGLQKKPTSSPNDAFDVVSIDPFTANTSILFGTDSLIAVAVGATAFDQQHKRYICWGFDDNNTQRLFVIDIDSNVVINKPMLNAQPIEMEYDLQTNITYGLTYSNGVEYLVEVDLNTGIVGNLSALPGVSAVVLNHSSFDSNNGRYIFMGIQNGQERLITVDVVTGNILTSVPFNQTPERIIAPEYDVNTNKLYALFTDIDSTKYSQQFMTYYKRLYFVEVDIASGQHTVVDSMPVEEGYFAGYALGGLAFDQATRSYIVKTADDNGLHLKVINAPTGQVVSSVSLANQVKPFYEIQVDNLQFAKTFYNQSTPTTSIKTVNGKLYPNPVKDILTLEIDEKIERLAIYSINGRVVQENNRPTTNQISTHTLPNGIYILKAATKNGVFQQQFMIFR